MRLQTFEIVKARRGHYLGILDQNAILIKNLRPDKPRRVEEIDAQRTDPVRTLRICRYIRPNIHLPVDDLQRMITDPQATGVVLRYQIPLTVVISLPAKFVDIT